MKRTPILAGIGALVALGSFATPVMASEREYSPPVANDIPRNLYWGDTHLHTRNSADAYSLKNTTLGPEQAYRFARGETVEAHNGMKVKLRHPLDFLVVSDHAEFLGVFALVEDRDPDILATPLGARWRSYLDKGDYTRMFEDFVEILAGERTGEVPRNVKESIWSDVASAADQFNEPGVLTTFSGFEWSSQPKGRNLHRVVVFKDDAETVSRYLPFSSIDSDDPEDLWESLSQYEQETGGSVFAIPHNGNLSNGQMFSPVRMNGEAIDKPYAQKRAKWEPLFEVTQIKGDSETHPLLSPDDEYADFETWDQANIMLTEPKEDWMLQYEYGRSALKLGLVAGQKFGVNPYQFGMVGSTDSHTSLSTTEESNFFGKFPESEPGPERIKNKMGGRLWANSTISASGLLGVWAKENTRDELFSSMQRKEVYATSGSRIKLRFFGGWGYSMNAHQAQNYADIGYREGVPMGSPLPARSGDSPPRFIVHAAKDPDGANLEIAQIVKGWLDSEGQLHETVYDIARGHKPDEASGAASGNGVNSSGSPELASVWEDPDFEASEPAFYYARVIEVKKPRWTAYDARYFKEDPPQDSASEIQDRAYSSPVWYTPRGSS